MKPATKTLVAISLFSLAAIVFFLNNLSDWQTMLPLALFYVVLLINTHFSLNLFFPLIPNRLDQKFVDFLLIVFYFALAFGLNNPSFFTYALALFFVLSSLKYVLLLNIVTNQPKLLKKKITANLLAVVLVLLTQGGILLGYETISLWTLAIIFALANINLLFVSPLYKLDQ